MLDSLINRERRWKRKLLTSAQQPRVNWWKKFNALDAKLRHDLFAGNLTQYEGGKWDQITLNENTDPAIIRKQLVERLNMATNAYGRQLSGYQEAGYSTPASGTAPAPAPAATTPPNVPGQSPTAKVKTAADFLKKKGYSK